MRLYGQEGMRAHIRKGVALAHHFKAMVVADQRFEIVVPVQLSLVCFRLKGPNTINEELNRSLYEGGQVYLSPSKLGDVYFLRMAVGSGWTEEDDLKNVWTTICNHATNILK
jgi:aromatic-L-amino-acid decarboxylase